MGCTASKLTNEDSVRRCKDRRRLIKEAVYSRHHLAAAHSDFLHSLKSTGSALSVFASGEPLSVADQTPAVLLPTPSSKPPSFHRHQPPPPVPAPAPATPKPRSIPATTAVNHHQRRPKPTIKLPHILSDSSQASYSPRENPNNNNYTYHAQYNYASTPSQASSVWNWENFYPPSPPDSEYFNTRNPNFDTEEDDKSSGYSGSLYSENTKAGSVYSTHNNNINNNNNNNNPKLKKHLQEDDKSSGYSGSLYSEKTKAGSVYSTHNNNINNNNNPKQKKHLQEDDKSSGYSGSLYSEKTNDNVSNVGSVYSTHSRNNNINNNNNNNPGYSGSLYSEKTSHNENKAGSVYSTNSRSNNNNNNNNNPKENEVEPRREEREEVQCSEWGDHDHDHYSTTSSTSDDEEIDNDSRSEMESRSNFGSSVHNAPSVSKSKFSFKSEKSECGYEDNLDMRMVVRHRDLAEIVSSIKEYFDKAAGSGEQVSEMLETGRAQLDRSFSTLKKTVYHSNGVFSNLSSSWTSKPPLAIKYRFEPGSIGEPGGSKSLCSTLERLLAWEMKLYQEVKAREGVKIEHERKLSSLQSQEYKGEDESKLNKTKASIKKLQSLIVVTSQAVTTTSTAIVGLRDAELVPQLIELCHGLMYMWRSMNQCHEVQNHVVQQVRGLVNRSTKGESTSDLHRQATRDLEAAVSAWHASFCRLIKFQRDFIRSLQGWFKLTLLPVNEEVNVNASQPSPSPSASSDVYVIFDEWKLALDRLPDTVASESIKSFINVVHSISLKQAEELKVKKRTESASKELEKKASSLRNIEKKYYHSYSMVGLGLPSSGQDDGHGLDARDPLSEKKSELVACQRRVEDEMVRHSKAVEVTRSMTLNNIQTGLPGVFQAMTSFSGLIMEALEDVCNKSYVVK